MRREVKQDYCSEGVFNADEEVEEHKPSEQLRNGELQKGDPILLHDLQQAHVLGLQAKAHGLSSGLNELHC